MDKIEILLENNKLTPELFVLKSRENLNSEF
jgi:hypothetical protein